MYHTKRRYSVTNKMIKSCKRVIYQLTASLQKKAHLSTSTTGKVFARIYQATSDKLSSLGLWWTMKIIGSVTSVFVFVMIIMSMWQRSWVIVFADNTLDIKELDDAYISLDWAILDSNQDFGARFSYIIKPWDTLDTIAREFWVTTKSLTDTNGLTSTVIKPWQELIISNVDGFVYQMLEQMTVRDFALKYRLDLQDIKELNAIQNDHDILLKDDQIFVPLTLDEWKKLWLIIPEPEPIPEPVTTISTPKPAKPSTKVSTKTTTKKTNQSVWWVWRVSQSRASCFWFVPWQCTCYAAQKRPDIFKSWQARPFGGNAKNWYNNAKAAWFAVGTKPAIGAVAVMPIWWWWYGHVGIVIDISGDDVLLESMNWVGPYIVNRIWIDTSRIRWYIY